MIDRRRQLAWIQRNREKVVRTVRLGEAVRTWASAMNSAGSASATEINAALVSVGDEEFRRCCRVLGIERGVLVVGVRDASLVGWMERTWRTRLIRALMEGNMNVTSVRFEYHRAPLTETGDGRE